MYGDLIITLFSIILFHFLFGDIIAVSALTNPPIMQSRFFYLTRSTSTGRTRNGVLTSLNEKSKKTTLPVTNISAQLSLYRKEQSRLKAIPASAVLTDHLISVISKIKPATMLKLASIVGMGAKRISCYGHDILQMVLGNKKKKITPPTNKKERKKRVKLVPTFVDPTPRSIPHPNDSGIYIIELEAGRVYVGTSKNIQVRIWQHLNGVGSAYTRVYKPTGLYFFLLFTFQGRFKKSCLLGIRLPRLGNVEGNGDAAERDETLRYMYQRGIPFVRGWKFSQVQMKTAEFEEAEANIRELFNLCRRCGYEGHFINRCKATYDRLGRQTTSFRAQSQFSEKLDEAVVFSSSLKIEGGKFE
jgi:hypothetical protein